MSSHSMSLLVILLILPLFQAAAPPSTDILIIGAGTAGCTLAGRLCNALPKARITLFERAPPRSADAEFTVRAARFAILAEGDEEISETWQSLPSEGLNGADSLIATGNTLGGSSAINGMQWAYPIDGTVERWNITGLTSSSARKYYKRAYRGVGFMQQTGKLSHAYGSQIVDAYQRAGFKKEFKPFSGRPKDSVWEHSVAVSKTGRRIDSCTAYVSPVLDSSCARNLQLVQGVTVTRVLLDAKRRATGVEYVSTTDKKMKRKRRILASSEIILSAGPFGSPKLLQLSGIGPATVLNKVGIEQKVELDVGTRTQARPITLLFSMYKEDLLDPINNSTILESKKTLRRWQRGKSSVLGLTDPSVLSRVGADGYVGTTTGFVGDGLDTPLLMSYCLSNPDSFGFLRIRSADPFDVPDVQLNLLDKTEDVKRQMRCLKKMKMAHKMFDPEFELEIMSPKGKVTDALIRESATHGYHFVGGCAVDSVVDDQFWVKGVDGLRVVDASVFKVMPFSAGPLGSTYMLAEFASEKIAKFNQKRFGR